MPLVVPQHSIRGVELGMSRPAVVQRLGKPAHVRHAVNDLGPYTQLRYKGLRITFAFDGGVSELETTAARDRTAHGAGVGSTEAEVRNAVPKLVCEDNPRHCHLGRYRAGSVVTDFFFRNGRVWRLVVGRVID
jgi:hypothetical protein